MHIKLICLAAAVLASFSAFAAPATANYFCDFEDDAENAEWITWAGTSVARQKHSTWRSGGAAFYSGQKGLYVTDPDLADDNTHSYPKASGYTVSVYRKMTLEAGTYTIALDYKCPSELISVSLISADTLEATAIQTQTGADYAAAVKNAIVPGLRDLKSTEWANVSVTHQVATAGTYLLAVTYRTSAGPDLEFGAAVDNVEVIKRQADPAACDYAISDLRLDLENGTAVLTWKGNADEYEVRYFDSEGRTVVVGTVPDLGAVDSCRVSLENMADGTYSFMVRGLGCGGNGAITGWGYLRHKLIYDPSAHCIDFLNFDARGVVCRYGEGMWGSSTVLESITSSTTGYTDYGSDSQYTTHTIHFKPNETDPITNHMLRTVPEGAFASVRLGSREPNNQYPGSHWQSVSYTIHVTEEMGVVLFRYAYIGQTGGHSGLEQSHIRLRLLDQAGNVINGEDCGSVLFTSPTNDAEMEAANRNPRTAGWHKGLEDPGDGTICRDFVYWRDWTTVGINVQDYLDQDIRIEVINYGCGASCHYGYCYFVLDCSKGEIIGQTCGEKPRELEVDEGFDYRWYTPYDPNHQFAADQDPTSRILANIAINDTNTYYCDLMRKGNNSCYFTLHAPAIKRLPRALVDVKHEPRDCQNFMVIENMSAVYGFFTNEAGQTDSLARDDEFARQSITWTSLHGLHGDLNATKSDTILFPNEGDLVTLTMMVEMKEGCTDEKTIHFAVPAIGPNIGRDTIYLVSGDSVFFQGKWYNEEGDYEVQLTNWMGCDSILSLHVDYLHAADSLTVDTICQGQTYHYETYEGRSFDYTTSGVYTDICKSKVLDSDSIVFMLQLTVLDSLAVLPGTTSCTVCADTSEILIDYTVLQGEAERCELVFAADNPSQLTNLTYADLGSNGSIAVPIDPADGSYRKPGIYRAKLTFYDKNGCTDQSFELTFDLLFPSKIIFQRWDDVLSVKKPDDNGGYTFAAYQWMKDGVDIEGQNASYYYAPDKLSTGSFYQVRLKDEEGLSWLSCPYYPVPAPAVMGVSPLTVSRGGQVLVSVPESASVRFYNISGLLLSAADVESGNTWISVPAEAGLCIVQVVADNEARSFRLNITE